MDKPPVRWSRPADTSHANYGRGDGYDWFIIHMAILMGMCLGAFIYVGIFR